MLGCCCWPTRGCRPVGTALRGVEALVDRGLLRTEHDLWLFLAGRLRTGRGSRGRGRRGLRAGRGPAARPDGARWDAAVSARLPRWPPEASWAQGAALLRTAAPAWPSAALDALRALPRAHHPLVLGGRGRRGR